METVSALPSGLNPAAPQPADPAPRLFEAINFQALHYGQFDASANDPRMRRAAQARTFAPPSALPAFRVH